MKTVLFIGRLLLALPLFLFAFLLMASFESIQFHINHPEWYWSILILAIKCGGICILVGAYFILNPENCKAKFKNLFSVTQA